MDRKGSAGKALAWSYAAVIAFSVVYFVGGLLLDKKAGKQSK
jgi:hypothetical protein